ncbi:MAG: site-specific DNA-methyltransferase, partial [Gammaproteobacteria bacterium]
MESKIAEIADACLRQEIGAEVKVLKKKTPFGLMFEEHEPEVVPCYAQRVKFQDRVGKRLGNLAETWKVLEIRDGIAECVKEADDTQHERIPLDQLVVVRRMGELIFPALTPMGSVANGDPQAPHHILIEADNYHALQLLLFPY